MTFCTHCGNQIITGAKFCTSCGSKVAVSHLKVKEFATGYKQKMYKNAVQSLKSEGTKFAQQKIKDALENAIQNKQIITEQNTPVAEVFKPNGLSSADKKASQTNKIGGIDIWTWIYIVISAILLYLGNALDEVIGIMLFSVIIILIVLLRRKKPKPYNWLVKIILVLQAVFLIALLADRIEFLGTITLLMAALLLVNVKLIFKRK